MSMFINLIGRMLKKHSFFGIIFLVIIMLRIRNYELKNNLIKKDTVIVNISDIHSDTEKLKSAINYINLIEPDIVTIPGDTLDTVDNEENDKIFELLSELAMTTKVFIGLGNHDFLSFKSTGYKRIGYVNKDCKFFENLKKKSKVNTLISNDEIYEVNGLQIIGFNPTFAWYSKEYENKEDFFKEFNEYKSNLKLKKDKFTIMLTHSCNGIITDNKLESEIDNVNLILSGHNHAGVTPEILQKLSKNNRGIMGPYNKWFMKSCYGFWTKDNTSVILSNALTKVGKSHGSKLLSNMADIILKSDMEVITLKNGDTHSLKLTSIIHQK